MASSNARHGSRTGSVRDLDTVAEFLTTKELCDVLVQRQLGNPLFLSRNFLCTRRVSPSGQDGGRGLPYVHYTCGHKAVDWSADVPGLGCLWCHGQPQVRFTRERDLMQHLRACHGQFRYVLDDSSLSAAGGAGVVVEMKLLTGKSGVLASRSDKLKVWDTEAVYANARRFPCYAAPRTELPCLGVWRTTRFVTKQRGGDGGARLAEGSVVPGRGKRRRPSRGMDVSGASGGADGGDGGGVTVLNAFCRERLVRAVRSNPHVTAESLNEFVTCFQPAGTSVEASVNASLRARQAPDVASNVVDSDETAQGLDANLEGPGDCDSRSGSASVRGSGSDSGSGSGSGSGRVNGCVSGSGSIARSAVRGDKNAAAGFDGNGRNAKAEGKRSGSRVGAFPSFAEGVERGIVFRSVLQSRPAVREFDDGADSDAENVIDEDWRLELGDELLAEFCDTTAQEKMYMNLWNQFALREVYVYSDRRQLDAACMFACRYGAIVFELHLEVIFVRHLGELHRRGLVDAQGMHRAVLELGKAREAAAGGLEHVDKLLTQFSFYNRIARREPRTARRIECASAFPGGDDPMAVETRSANGAPVVDYV